MAIDRKYVSETDTFISNLLAQKPEIKQKQQCLRHTWWDKNFIDQAEQKNFAQSSTPKHGYAYFDYSSNDKKN